MTSNLKLNDKIMREKILAHYKNTIIIEELVLCLGEARADLAILDSKVHGIEIKSDKDTLDRLDTQIPIYNKIFETIEIVIGYTHLKHIKNAVPSWWGISIIKGNSLENITYKKIRISKPNKIKESRSAVELLWKSEILALLNEKDPLLPSFIKRKAKAFLWDYLVSSFKKEELFEYINQCLKNRQNWRLVQQLK